MRLLLDTHVWLWLVSDQERLSAASRELFADHENDLLLSAAAIWEIGVKLAAGKLNFTGSPRVLVPQYIKRSGVQPLAIVLEHALRAADLPPHHRDPFDRMMVAQAQHESLTLVSADSRMAAYDVAVVNPVA